MRGWARSQEMLEVMRVSSRLGQMERALVSCNPNEKPALEAACAELRKYLTERARWLGRYDG